MKYRFMFILTLISLAGIVSGCSSMRDDARDTSSTCAASDCHPATVLKSYYPTDTKLHQNHVNTLKGKYSEPCSQCHFSYNNVSYHKNGSLDGSLNNRDIIYFSPAVNPGGSWDMASKTCSNLTCHGNIVWNANSPSTCVAICHQSGNTFPGAAPDPMANGSHTGHISGTGLTCVDCHYGYKENPAHDDGNLDTTASSPSMIAFNAANNPNGSYNGVTHQCSGTICHGNFTGGNNTAPSWGGTVSCASTSCHGGNTSGNPASSTSADAKHGTHVGMLTVLINPSTGFAYTETETCSVCHSAGTAVSHNNGQIDIAFTYSQAGSLGSATGGNVSASGGFNAVVCANTYCHGNFTGGNTASVSWSDTVACGSCHPANTTSPASVKHTKHLTQYPDQCAYCHSGYTKSSTPANHVNFVKNVAFGYTHPLNTAGNPSYNTSSKTCANVYCHGNFPWVTYNGTANTNPGNGASPTWLDGSSAPCGSCHGGVNNNYSSKTHGKHTATTSTYFNNSVSIESCDACHNYGTDSVKTFGSDSTQGSYGTVLYHANFSIDNLGVNSDVYFKTDNSDLASKLSPETLVAQHTTWNPGSTTCTNSWCHGNFTKPGTLDGYLNINTPNWLDSTSAACGTCHTATPGTSGAHTKHTAGTAGNYSYGCGKCHGGFTGHVNGNIAGLDVSVSFDNTNPNGSYNTGTGTCTDLYCHGNTTNNGGGNDWGNFTGSASAKNDNPTWTGGALTCGINCHSATSSTLSTGSHSKHIGNSASAYNYPCRRCHDDTFSGDTTAFAGGHADGNLTISFQTGLGSVDIVDIGGVFNATDHTCSNTYCHGNFTGGKQATATVPAWGGASLTCSTEPCHSLAPLKAAWGSHDKHTNTGGNSGYNYDCSLCHSGIASGKEGAAISLTGSVNTSGHADFTRDIVFSGIANQYTSLTASYNGISHVCANTYCHGAFGSGTTQWLEGNSSNTATWGGAAFCGTCHGTIGTGRNAALGIPDDATGWGADSHVKHAGNYDSSIANSAADVSNKGYKYPCGFCHYGSYDATLASMTTTTDANGDTTYNTYAGNGSYETSTKTPGGYALHANGARNVNFYQAFTKGSSYASNTTFTSVSNTCSYVYCHSDGYDIVNFTTEPVGAVTTPVWGTGAFTKSTMTCTSCHNSSDNATQINDTYRAPDHGSSKGHYSDSEHSMGCVFCHYNVTGSGSSRNSASDYIDYSKFRHVNRQKDVKLTANTADVNKLSFPSPMYYRNYNNGGNTDGFCDLWCHSKADHKKNGWYNYNNNFKGVLKFETTP